MSAPTITSIDGVTVTWGTKSILLTGVKIADIGHKFPAQLERLLDENGGALARVYFDFMEELTLSGMLNVATGFPKIPGTIVTLTAPDGVTALGKFFLDDSDRKLTNKSAAQLTLKLSRDINADGTVVLPSQD